jgi:hypothetical protein
MRYIEVFNEIRSEGLRTFFFFLSLPQLFFLSLGGMFYTAILCDSSVTDSKHLRFPFIQFRRTRFLGASQRRGARMRLLYSPRLSVRIYIRLPVRV